MAHHPEHIRKSPYYREIQLAHVMHMLEPDTGKNSARWGIFVIMVNKVKLGEALVVLSY